MQAIGHEISSSWFWHQWAVHRRASHGRSQRYYPLPGIRGVLGTARSKTKLYSLSVQRLTRGWQGMVRTALRNCPQADLGIIGHISREHVWVWSGPGISGMQGRAGQGRAGQGKVSAENESNCDELRSLRKGGRRDWLILQVIKYDAMGNGA